MTREAPAQGQRRCRNRTSKADPPASWPPPAPRSGPWPVRVHGEFDLDSAWCAIWTGLSGETICRDSGGRPPFRQAGQVDGRLGGILSDLAHRRLAPPHGHHDVGNRRRRRWPACCDGPGAIARRDSVPANADRHAMRGVSVTHGRQVQSLAFGARQRDAQQPEVCRTARQPAAASRAGRRRR